MKCIILSLLTLVTGCTTGTHYVTGLLGPPISPAQVVVYYSTPTNSTTIGRVTAHSYGGLTYADASADALTEIRLQAGGLGANGVVVYNTDTAPLCGAHVRANAIFVSPSRSD